MGNENDGEPRDTAKRSIESSRDESGRDAEHCRAGERVLASDDRRAVLFVTVARHIVSPRGDRSGEAMPSDGSRYRANAGRDIHHREDVYLSS